MESSKGEACSNENGAQPQIFWLNIRRLSPELSVNIQASFPSLKGKADKFLGSWMDVLSSGRQKTKRQKGLSHL